MVPIFILLTISFIVATDTLTDRAATPTVASQITFLLDEERTLRERLAVQVQRLKQQVADVYNGIPQCACPTAPPKTQSSPKIAYTGILNAAMSGLTAATILNFTSDLTNVGNAFSVAKGHFIAPVSGIYGFSLASYLPVGNWAQLQLVQNGNSILFVKSGHYSSTLFSMGTNFVLANLTAGNEVWPQYITGTGTIYADGYTTFSGFLLHEF